MELKIEKCNQSTGNKNYKIDIKRNFCIIITIMTMAKVITMQLLISKTIKIPELGKHIDLFDKDYQYTNCIWITLNKVEISWQKILLCIFQHIFFAYFLFQVPLNDNGDSTITIIFFCGALPIKISSKKNVLNC